MRDGPGCFRRFERLGKGVEQHEFGWSLVRQRGLRMLRHGGWRRGRRSLGLSDLLARDVFFGFRRSIRLRRRSRLHGRLDQRDQADIGPAADPLQHHLADADRRLGAALAERIAARLIEAGISEIAEAEQGTGGLAGADEQAVGRERRHRHLGVIDETKQALDQRHGA
ncbi:hypothetical protein ACVWWR_001827 [Bradyrhizobium sp. LM3.2]